jgi:hypothetical protein
MGTKEDTKTEARSGVAAARDAIIEDREQRKASFRTALAALQNEHRCKVIPIFTIRGTRIEAGLAIEAQD